MWGNKDAKGAADASAELASLTAKLKNAQSHHKHLLHVKNNADAIISEAESDRVRLSGEKSSWEDEIKDIDAMLLPLVQDLERLAAERDGSSSTSSSGPGSTRRGLSTYVRRPDEQNAGIKSNKENLDSPIASLEASIESLRSRRNDCQARLESVEDALAKCDETISEAKMVRDHPEVVEAARQETENILDEFERCQKTVDEQADKGEGKGEGETTSGKAKRLRASGLSAKTVLGVVAILAVAALVAFLAIPAMRADEFARTFPDESLRSAVLSMDPNNDGYLSSDELASITSLTAGQTFITSLEGIDKLTGLKEVDLRLDVSEADLTGLPALERAEIYLDSEMTSLSVAGNASLVELEVSGPGAVDLDLSDCTSLETLSVGPTVERMDVSGCSALESFHLYNGLKHVTMDGDTFASTVSYMKGNAERVGYDYELKDN